MRRMFFISMLLVSIIGYSFAQYKGKFEVYKYDNVTLHSYTSYEDMGDVSFVIEGDKELVVLEQPSFFNSINEFKSYCEELKKPVVKVVSSYHSGGLLQWDPSIVVMIEGMPEFEKGEMVQNMMKGFAERFGGKMDTRAHSNTNVIPANSTQRWADIQFKFISAPPTSAFPAADLIIAGKIYYMHSAPAISHIRGLRDKNTIDPQLAYLKNIKNSGCELIVGSHGYAARLNSVDFQISYLEKMKEALSTAKNKEDFVRIMNESFSGLSGENNLKSTADLFYK